DARYFAPPLQHPDWPRDQLDRWYEAPVSALTLQDGCVDVTVGPGAAAGAPAVVRLAPAGTPLRVENRCTTVGKDGRHVVAVGRKPATDVIVVRGSVRLGSRPRTVSIALRDPAIVVGHVLRRALEAEGVSVGGQVRLATADDPPASHGSVPIAGCATPLAQTVPVILKRSQNLWAESLCKVLGAERGGEGSFRAGSAVVRKRVLALGVAPEQIALVDGSGLARDNRASARALVTVLRAAARGPNAALFVGALPIGGLDGTLRKRLRDRPDAARVRAKTGTIRGVSTLSGYVLPARPGEATLVFSILTNGVRGGAGAARRLQDRIVEVLLDTHLPAQPAATPAGAEAGR
ncbi:MAG: D-alanyl-D-alanine carboxypeptidase/D-alanyl-D-alanine-endopeptidase, partial [Planctomycetota bacterium]